ncbi:hypothetical protein AOQ84DRAFT_102350 [Glonium stellatum]|uniref:Uncharacterized protein n=1 Tax=Glonium stellatum TaxID=574774 RepID=A0A8E2EUH4_9PEZI|nr:hypothetical protein AOQ84DRAFT_102350 [Glonium stellatum]
MEQPVFEFLEVVDNDHVDHLFSFGNSEFQHYIDDAPIGYAFTIFKNVALRKLDVVIRSPFLQRTLQVAEPCVLSLVEIAQRYAFLKETLFALEGPNSLDFSYGNPKELRLLVQDFLLDRKVFSGFNLEQLYDQGIISLGHWQDLQHWSTLSDVRAIDNAFQKRCHSQAGDANKSNGNLPSDNALDLYQNHRLSSASANGRDESRAKLPPLPRSRGYRPSRAVLSLWNRLPDETYGHETPIDVEDTLIWDLGEYHISILPPTSPIDLYLVIEIKIILNALYMPFLLDPGLRGASRFGGHGMLIHHVSDSRLASWNLPMGFKLRCIRRLSKHEKQSLITARVHAAFKVKDQKFRAQVKNINWDKHRASSKGAAYMNISSCDFIFQLYHKAWNKGISTIRQFLRGKRPQTLEQICRLLQVAYVMGSQDPKNPDFRASFIDDLGRWRVIVPEHSLPCFDAIVEAVWGRTFDNGQSDTASGYGANENILQLQQLLSSLISRNPLTEISKEDKQHGHTFYRNEQDLNAGINSDFQAAHHVVGAIEDPRAYSQARKLPICLEPADSTIVLMMAGAIFGFVFSFLLIFYSFTSSDLSFEVASQRDLYFANFEERNVHTLLLYLGLSTCSFLEKKKVRDENEAASQISLQPMQEEVSPPVDGNSTLAVPEQPAIVHR